MWKLDLADLSSVRDFAQRFLDSGKPLHMLMNNAGLVSWEHAVTKDGHELTYQTNHLGHFLLTKLLMPRLQASAPARVVQVSSEAHYMGDVWLDDLDWDTSKRKYNAMKQYANTKLMNVVFANELTRRYKDSGVVSTSVVGLDGGRFVFDLYITAGADQIINLHPSLLHAHSTRALSPRTSCATCPSGSTP